MRPPLPDPRPRWPATAQRPTSSVSIAPRSRGQSLARLAWGLALALAIGCSDAESPESKVEHAQTANEQTGALPAASPAFRALWVLCEGSAETLASPERIDALVEHAIALGVSDLFVQVYRSGRAWYDASLADPTPFREIVEKTGTDPLRRLLPAAHARGLRVHAWVNVLSLNANRSAPILIELGPGAVMVDRRGRSLLDYPSGEVPAPDRTWYRMGTPGLYLDPATPGVRERLVATFVELVDRYPELDGLHLDYIRHPGVLPFAPGSRFGVGLDFGYGEATRQRFQTDTGLPGPYADPSNPAASGLRNANEWDAWRREQVTSLVREIRGGALARRPGLLVSAAVIAYADRAYLSLAQDWRGWIDEGLLDFAVPMIYTLDDRLFGYHVRAFASGPNAERIWMGAGTWLFASSPARALAQLDLIRETGSTGEALFSYDALLESDALLEALLAAAPRAAGVVATERSTP